ncbi:MAG: lipoate--protein ligase family protein [Acidobacteria bacterium]|nr:lipoate--protein ligase family protein [Acidobacteriota bacterium]
MSPFRVSELPGSATDLHARQLVATDRRVEVLRIDRPALVLGSTQATDDVDRPAADALGVEVVRRRSGGGAVLLLPGVDLWLDVSIPRDDPLWSDDVTVSFEWLGRAWAEAVESLGLPTELHTGAALQTRWSRRICFAGIGAGEVLTDGRKLVGISQRRTREAARFQCAVLRTWDPVSLLGLLEPVATGLDRPTTDLLPAFLEALPS